MKEDRQTIAIIDIGTVSTRLFICDVYGNYEIHVYERRSLITGLGEGVSKTKALDPRAIERTVSVVSDYLSSIKEFSTHQYHVDAVQAFLTSAARDGENVSEIITRLRGLGLSPVVIPGDIEARLTFLGVAPDFPGENILVADVGGGSTELIAGCFDEKRKVPVFETVRSYDVGASRVAEMFLNEDPYSPEALDEAREWIASVLSPFWTKHDVETDRIVCVGGSATSVVSIMKKLDPYDPLQVHGEKIDGGDLSDMIDDLATLTLMERGKVVGLQTKRAPFIVPGALILESILALSGFSELSVSESDSLYGAVRHIALRLDGRQSPLEWDVSPTLI